MSWHRRSPTGSYAGLGGYEFDLSWPAAIAYYDLGTDATCNAGNQGFWNFGTVTSGPAPNNPPFTVSCVHIPLPLTAPGPGVGGSVVLNHLVVRCIASGTITLHLGDSTTLFDSHGNDHGLDKQDGTLVCGSGGQVTPTSTPTTGPTAVGEGTVTLVPSTSTPTPTDTPMSPPPDTPTPTNTPVPTDTPTNTPVPTDTPTNTPVPTDTPTNTPVQTDTPTNTPVQTDTPTNTPVPTDTPTNTPVPTDTSTKTPVPTETPVPGRMTGGGSIFTTSTVNNIVPSGRA
jgi:hypothetical protein